VFKIKASQDDDAALQNRIKLLMAEQKRIEDESNAEIAALQQQMKHSKDKDTISAIERRAG
jgi:hypothetical protein